MTLQTVGDFCALCTSAWWLSCCCFHFVIIPLTVDCGIFSSKDISRLDLLHRWQPITVPRLNSLSS
ncbi:unnamed protein product [Staurois parvus]|uniref:Secreted protein n=1 Tax=Staurois parvus TaxID=386267 RepID=A0ABN9DH07_9NEOB|nr:unnamed protein product [Staurois parvus]